MSEKTLKQENVATEAQQDNRFDEYIDRDKFKSLIDSKQCLMLKRDPQGRRAKAKDGSIYVVYSYYILNRIFHTDFRINIKPKDKGPDFYRLIEFLFRIMPEVPVIRERTQMKNDGKTTIIDKFIIPVYDKINDGIQEIVVTPDSASEKRALVNMFDRIAPVAEEDIVEDDTNFYL